MRLLFLTLSVLMLSTHMTRGDDVALVLVGTQKQLFVDNYVIAESQNVERVLGRVEKVNEGQPIFTDGWFYGTVLHSDDQFKLWFRKFNGKGYGYAESVDGIHFTKKADLTGINFAGDVNLAVELNRPDARPSQRRKVGCKQCGFPADLSRHANDGGSLEGSGAGGIVDVIDSTGGSKDDGYGSDQRYRTGAGCPHCFSKNFAL